MTQTKRYDCICDTAKVQQFKDTYVFERQNVVQLPAWSKARKIRLQNGHPPDVSIDSCIVDAILALWEKGIETTGCCCGHKLMRAWVSVDPSDYVAMHELGYEQAPITISEEGYAMNAYTFYL